MSRTIAVTWLGLDRAEKDLRLFREKAIPYAVRNTLNDAAFVGRRLWQKKMRKAFTLRNRWTQRSALVERAHGTDLGSMESQLGSAEAYLAQQEEGFVERAKGKHGVPIPTSAAADQDGANPRTNLVNPTRYLSAINLAKRPGAVSRQARNYAAMAQAAKAGTRFVLLELRGGKMAIFEASSHLGNVQTGNDSLTMRMVWDLSRKSVSVDAHPTMSPALDDLLPQLPSIQRRHIIKQLQRAKVFGY